MSDRSHLDEFLAATTDPLYHRLVTIFRDCARNPALSNLDCVTRLKNLLEESLHEATEVAPAEPHDP
jgi:hypothetical protein